MLLRCFEHLIAEIQEIRASERRFYQKITDIYAKAVDYDKNSQMTREFYATVQNKMHYAVHGNTAAEVIVARADHNKEHMGLKSKKCVKLCFPIFHSHRNMSSCLSCCIIKIHCHNLI